MFCPKCGNQIAPGNKFCTVCGNPVRTNAANVQERIRILNELDTVPEESPDTAYAPAETEQEKPPRPAKKKLSGGKKALIVISVILIFIIGLGITGFILIENSPAKEVVILLDKGKYEKAAKLYKREVEDNIILDKLCQSILAKQFDAKSNDFPDGEMKYDETGGRTEITIGRNPSCDIVLPHISVSKLHTELTYENGFWYISDNGSTNGVIINDERLYGKKRLHEKDVIAITNSKLIFTSRAIFYCSYKNGISVDTSNVVIVRGRGKKAFVTGNNISLNVKPGELAAIIGGSGAGKSTILNCMCGYLQPTRGTVHINGVNLYQNFDSLKKLIGYVP